jgi:thymidine kinase
MAKLYFRYGAMNSGKSTALLQVAHNYEERDMNILLIKAKVDSKGEDTVVSRLGVRRKVDILAKKGINLYDTVAQWNKDVEKISCVIVDEAQFLTATQIDQLFNLTTYERIPVLCYGLRTDFRTQLFPGAARLFALAHSIEELKTICRCGKKAIMNGRKIGGTFIFEGSQLAIDGVQDVTYESLCGTCYLKELTAHQ